MTAVLLVYDAGPGVGLGHRARMTNLALALRLRGADARLALDVGGGGVDVLVVDSYLRRADEFRGAARKVVAVDDLDRDLVVDLLIDPNPPPHHGGRARHHLAGVDYALIAPVEPGALPAEAVRTVLVTAGAADTAGTGARVATALVDLLPEAEVRLVVGQWGDGRVPPGVVPVRAPAGLEAELRRADVVVSAAGVTMLEACLLGRPVVAFVTADNQRRSAAGAAAAGAVVYVPLEAVPPAVAVLATDAAARRALAVRAAVYVDGRGPDRVAEAVLELV